MSEENSAFKKVEWDGDQYRPADDDLDELPTPPRRSLAPDDRALLELAARAIACIWFEDVEGEEWVNLHFTGGTVTWSWNPLKFNGDAFELMVRLRLAVTVRGSEACVHYGRPNPIYERGVENGSSLSAATCRAIVRAAAEIGSGMP